MKVTVRQTKRLILIEELNKKHFPSNPIEHGGDRVYFLAKLGRQVVGWCALVMLPHERAAIYRTGVLLEFRNQGIKKKLVRAMERYAASHGATMMTSYCSTDNVESANSLISSGYKLYIPDVYDEGDYRDWMCWRKRLVPPKRRAT